MVTTTRVSGWPVKFGYGMPEVLLREFLDALGAALGGVTDHPTAHGVVAEHLIGVDDVHRDAGVPDDVLDLLIAVDDVDHHVLAVGGHPGLRQLRRTVGHHRRDETRAGSTQAGPVDRRAGVQALGLLKFDVPSYVLPLEYTRTHVALHGFSWALWCWSELVWVAAVDVRCFTGEMRDAHAADL